MVMVYPKGKKPSLKEVKEKIRFYHEKWGTVGEMTIVMEGYPRGLVKKAIAEMEAAGEIETEEE